MAPGAHPDDERRLAELALALAEGIERALPGWVERCVATVVAERAPELGDGLAAQASEAGRRAAAEIGPLVRALLEADLDAQRTTPLALVRRAVRYPTEVLRAAGVPPRPRDPFVTARFPDDDYDLSPAGYVDLDPALHELGMAWGAAKAFVHRRRHLGAGGSPTAR
jgi:hypothetical protein